MEREQYHDVSCGDDDPGVLVKDYCLGPQQELEQRNSYMRTIKSEYQLNSMHTVPEKIGEGTGAEKGCWADLKYLFHGKLNGRFDTLVSSNLPASSS